MSPGGPSGANGAFTTGTLVAAGFAAGATGRASGAGVEGAPQAARSPPRERPRSREIMGCFKGAVRSWSIEKSSLPGSEGACPIEATLPRNGTAEKRVSLRPESSLLASTKSENLLEIS